MSTWFQKKEQVTFYVGGHCRGFNELGILGNCIMKAIYVEDTYSGKSEGGNMIVFAVVRKGTGNRWLIREGYFM